MMCGARPRIAGDEDVPDVGIRSEDLEGKDCKRR